MCQLPILNFLDLDPPTNLLFQIIKDGPNVYYWQSFSKFLIFDTQKLAPKKNANLIDTCNLEFDM